MPQPHGTASPRVLLLGLFLSAGLLRSQEVIPYVELGAGRKQGDFGTPIQNTLWMGYATAGASGGRWDANLTVPFLGLDRDGAGVSLRDRGLGDIVAQGAYRFLPETEEGWSLDGGGALKFPTASDTKGLGTGRTDAGAFLSLHQRLGLFQWTLLGGWIQAITSNQPSSADGYTSGAYVAGLRGEWDFDRARWGLAFEARGATFQGEPGARELTLDVFHPLTPTWGLKAAVTAGFTDGGPRQSVGVAVVHLFL